MFYERELACASWLCNWDQNRLWDRLPLLSGLAFSVQLRVLDLNPVGSKVKDIF